MGSSQSTSLAGAYSCNKDNPIQTPYRSTGGLDSNWYLKNDGSQNLKIAWVNDQGQIQNWNDLSAGVTYSSHTGSQHWFVIQDPTDSSCVIPIKTKDGSETLTEAQTRMKAYWQAQGPPSSPSVISPAPSQPSANYSSPSPSQTQLSGSASVPYLPSNLGLNVGTDAGYGSQPSGSEDTIMGISYTIFYIILAFIFLLFVIIVAAISMPSTRHHIVGREL